jgi:hypothetical protein
VGCTPASATRPEAFRRIPIFKPARALLFQDANRCCAVMPSKKAALKLACERRQSERAVAYWEQKAGEFKSPPTLTRLDPGSAIDGQDWQHRFVIAPDRFAELSTFLMCGSNVARSLELSEGALKQTVMFRKIPKQFLELFARGCAEAILSGSPVRISGAIEREDARRELYRSSFMPVGANLVFGAFNSTIRVVQARSPRDPGDWLIDDVFPAVSQIRAAGTKSLSEITAALNDRGFRPPHGHRWTQAMVRSLLLQASG